MASTDVLILTALQDELAALLTLGGEWTESRDLNGFRYFHISLTNQRNEMFNVAAAWIGEMGERSAVARGQQLLTELSPACLAMCGICAGYREKVSLGDVIVADQIWNYDEGKRTEDGFSHATRTFDMHSTWKMDAAFLAKEMDLAPLSALRPPARAAQVRWFMHALVAHETEGKPAPVEHVDRNAACPNWASVVKYLLAEALIERKGRVFVSTAKGRDWVDEDSLMNPDGLPKEPPLRVHVGAVATGSAVVEDPGIFERLRKIVRSTIAIEMEGAALGELAARFQKQSILVKAVQDFADHDKDDGFRVFACKASAAFLFAFLQKHFEPQREPAPPPWPPSADMDDEDPFLGRVERIVRLRHAGAGITRHPTHAPFAGLLEVAVDMRGFFETRLVAALDGPITESLAHRFLDDVEKSYRARNSMLRTTLVHRGDIAPKPLRERLFSRGVLLETFDQYQGLFDLSAYLDWQTRELERSTVYAPGIYVEQHATIEIAGNLERLRTEDVLRSLWDLLLTPSQRRFVLVLGEFGAGKTFLLRELCRRMGRDRHPVWPVLLEMSKLEKQHDLAELLGAHFGRAEVPGYNFKAFQYLLEEGRIALFFDGYDELADRVTYDNATAHFDTVLSAAQGQAKVLLSSRRQHFLTDGDADKAVRRELAKKAEGVAGAGYRLVMIEPFGEKQIRAYLNNVLGNAAEAEARYRLIDEVKDLLGLSHNPRMLGFIAAIPEASLRAAKEEKGEITSAGLYEVLVKNWLDFEHERSKRMGSSKGIPRAALDKGVELLAVSMWHERARTVEVDRIRDILQKSSVAAGEHSLDPDIVAFMFAAGSLLVRDSEGNFSFVHRSVMEWLVARVSARELLLGEEPAALGVDEMSALMADFFVSMGGRERVVWWARENVGVDGVVQKNAALLLKRMGERFERVNFEGQDLRGRDFSGVDWRGANLRRADLRGVMLKGASLAGASLAEAQFSGANLSGATLARADIAGADFAFARLDATDFSQVAPIEPVRFRGANLLAARGISEEYTGGLIEVGAVPPILASVKTMAAAALTCLCIASSPNGELLAVGQVEGTIWLIDMVAGKVLRVLSGHVAEVRALAFSPDGTVLASGSSDKTIRFWDVSTGRGLRASAMLQEGVLCVAFSPDGKTIASGSVGKAVRLWDTVTGRPSGTFDGHEAAVYGIAFSPDGSVIASGSADFTVRLWDSASGQCVATLAGHHEAPISSVAFTPDGKMAASGSWDNTVRLWSFTTGGSPRVLRGHRNRVNSIAFSPDGKMLVSGSDDRTIRLWAVANGELLRTLDSHHHQVCTVVFSPDGKSFVSGSLDNSVRVWDVGTDRSLRTFRGHHNPVFGVSFSPDGKKLASSSSENGIRLWAVNTGRSLRTVQGHVNRVVCVAFSHGGRVLASGSWDKTVRLWDASSGRSLRVLKGHKDWVWSVAFSPDGKAVASGSEDNTLRVWDVASGESSLILAGHKAGVSCVAFAPDGKTIASGSEDKTLRLWDASAGSLLCTFAEHANRVLSAAFSPDSRMLASASYDKTVRLWQVGAGSCLLSLSGHLNRVYCVTFSPDGALLASGSEDKTVRFWNAKTGNSVRVLEGHASTIFSVAFSPDGQTLASGSNDGTIRLWHVSTGKCFAILLATPNGWVAFTPDGRYKYGGEITGSFWHIAGLCRFEPGELDLRLPDDADFRNLPPPPTSIQPCRPNTLPPAP